MQYVKWLPLLLLSSLAMAFEPIRSGFTWANQSCEWVTNLETARGAVFNLRHLISYGILCLVALLKMGRRRLFVALTGVFLFSALLELEQSFFITGHCRSWDLIPNLLGIGAAAVLYLAGARIAGTVKP